MDFESLLNQLFSVILSSLLLHESAIVVLVLTIFWDSMSLCAASFERKVVSLHSFIHLFKSRLKIKKLSLLEFQDDHFCWQWMRNFSAQAQKFLIFEKKLSLGVRTPWHKLWHFWSIYTLVHNVSSGSKSIVIFDLIKLSSHPCYPSNFDWFLWKWKYWFV